MNYLVLGQRLNEMERTLKRELARMVGKTIRHNNGKEYEISSVSDNYIETTNGKTFILTSLTNFNVNAEFNSLLAEYIEAKNNGEETIKRLKQPVGTCSFSAVDRSMFWDKILERLPYKDVLGGNKRDGDPQYLHLNLSDEFYDRTGYTRSNLSIGFNLGCLELAVYVIVRGTEAKRKMMSGIKRAIKVNGHQAHKVKEGRQSEDGNECGIRITDEYALYSGEFNASIDYLLELLDDTLHAIEKVGNIYE